MSSSISSDQFSGGSSTTRPDSKVQILCTRLRDLARQQEPDTRLPSMRELCQLLGTTRVTLGEALDVLEEQNIIYRKERSGIYVSPKFLRRTVCVLLRADYVLSVGSSPVWGMLWAQLAAEAQRRSSEKNEYYSFHLIMQPSDDILSLPEDVIAMIQAGKVHAVLGVGLSNADSFWLAQRHMPQVSFAGVGHCSSMVILDFEEMYRLAIEQLALQGCRRVALWEANHLQEGQSINDFEPNPAFIHFLKHYSLPFYPELYRPTSSVQGQHLTTQEIGYQIALDVFGKDNEPRPDGIVIANDLITDGVLVALEQLGTHIGHDVKIATHANAGSPVLFARLRDMAVIEYDPVEFAQAMFKLLDSLLYEHDMSYKLLQLKPRLRR